MSDLQLDPRYINDRIIQYKEIYTEEYVKGYEDGWFDGRQEELRHIVPTVYKILKELDLQDVEIVKTIANKFRMREEEVKIMILMDLEY